MSKITENFTAKFDVSATKGAPAKSYECSFDLSELTEDDMLELARRSMVIAQQARIRAWLAIEDKSSEKYTKFEPTVYKVPKPGTRSASDPMKKVQELLAKLTPEQRAALLAAK